MSDETKCGKKATARYRWGGLGDESYACDEHGQQLASLCDHMRWAQVFIKLDEDTERVCGSFVEEPAI